jgi:hypothetical protein
VKPRGNALGPGECVDVFDLAKELVEQRYYREVERHTVEQVVSDARDFDVRADVLALLVLGSAFAPVAVLRDDAEMIEAIALVEEAGEQNLQVRVVT